MQPDLVVQRGYGMEKLMWACHAGDARRPSCKKSHENLALAKRCTDIRAMPETSILIYLSQDAAATSQRHNVWETR